jgi:hypothetical protein
MRTRVTVLGAGISGVTVALAVKDDLGDDADVTVVAPASGRSLSPRLFDVPRPRHPIGSDDDAPYPVAALLHRRHVGLVIGAVAELDPVGHRVVLDSRRVLYYDHLVVATGFGDDHAGPATRLPAALVEVEGLTDDDGLLPVRRSCQSVAYDDIFGIGVAVAGDVRLLLDRGEDPTSVMERMAQVIATNITARSCEEPVVAEMEIREHTAT